MKHIFTLVLAILSVGMSFAQTQPMYLVDYVKENQEFAFLVNSYGYCLDSLRVVKGLSYVNFEGDKNGVSLVFFTRSKQLALYIREGEKVETLIYSFERSEYWYTCFFVKSDRNLRCTETPPENLQERYIELLEKFCNSK